ncbi:hypothetical protein [Nostoc sp. GT001]|uniref:hypothetical protein n=1 Tax=Nostoc sp. GT001 TaxID=3056647 RepID=UPI0025AA7264|nr:hypothetical protein [Nostoc sp. GT001]MDM9584880.1 hypothetical protein [Nostoc sp. GT001]
MSLLERWCVGVARTSAPFDFAQGKTLSDHRRHRLLKPLYEIITIPRSIVSDR